MKIKLITIILYLSCMTNPLQASDRPTKEEKEFHYRLFTLISQGELDSVKQIVEAPEFELSTYDNNDYYHPLLYAASWNEHKEIVQYLIDKGANPNARTRNNDSPLHRAAWKGNLEIVKLLVENGAELNIVYNANGGLTPLCCAAESNNIEVVKYLVEKGADIYYTNSTSGASPLRSAAYSGNYDIFLFLAEKQPEDYNWQEGLFYGIIGGNPEIVKYIIEKKGASVNKKSITWNTYPIQEAANNKYRYGANVRHVEIIKYLVSKGARLTQITNGNLFSWAMEKSNEETMEYLIKQGIKVEIPPMSDGWTPLAASLDNNNFALARYLLKNTKDHTFRNTPLVVFFADGLYNSPEIIDVLIKAGVNKEHYTQAFKNSVLANDSVSTCLLLDAGADIHALNPDSSNILHLSRSYGVAKLLIEKGADMSNKVMQEHAWKNPPLLHALEENGIYPPISKENMGLALMGAAEGGDIRTVEYLLKRGVDVNFSFQVPDIEIEIINQTSSSVPQSEEDEIQYERNQEIYGNNHRTYKQTALIKNAIKGYGYGGHGSYDKNEKIQISSDITELLLSAGADPNLTDWQGRTALHYAAGYQTYREMPAGPIPIGSRRDREHGTHGDPAMPSPCYHDSITWALIKKGADINLRDHNGDTPIILAAKSRNDGSLKILLEAGADINIKNNNGRDIFSYIDNLEAFQIVKEAGLQEKISQNNLNVAFRNFFLSSRIHSALVPDKLKALIDYGADVNMTIYTGDNTNALMYTFKNLYGDRKRQIAQVLIDGGIDLYAENKDGYTVPMFLIKNGTYKEQYTEDPDLINLRFFVKNNTDLNYKSNRQYTALGIAIHEKEEEAVAFLTSHGAKRDLASEWWYLVTQYYYHDEIIPMLEQLVREGVDVNLESPVGISKYIREVNQEGITALMLFTAYGKEKVIQALLQMGADVNKKAADGTTAFSIAKNRNKQLLMDILIQAGARE
ncbi:MAG: ankyrin repeat domain-containing protein [Candidatus Azobacteroides sp.]|nr:ankyrin repeat domain-containing protein [Candidatus Azobacteroides sp.]